MLSRPSRSCQSGNACLARCSCGREYPGEPLQFMARLASNLGPATRGLSFLGVIHRPRIWRAFPRADALAKIGGGIKRARNPARCPARLIRSTGSIARKRREHGRRAIATLDRNTDCSASRIHMRIWPGRSRSAPGGRARRLLQSDLAGRGDSPARSNRYHGGAPGVDSPAGFLG